MQPGDFVTHIDHGVGTVQRLAENGSEWQDYRKRFGLFIKTVIFFMSISTRFTRLQSIPVKKARVPKVNKLGSDVWNRLKKKTKAKVKEIAFDLIKLYARRKAQQGFAHSPDNYMQTELEASFIYEDTPDQSKATG